MIRVSDHAISRYRERVAQVSFTEAREALSSPAIRLAAEFSKGEKVYVRLGTGQRVVVEGGCVTTVLPFDTIPWKLGALGDRIRRHARGWAHFDQHGVH